MEREFLGMIYNSRDMSMDFLQTKVEKVLKCLTTFEKLERCSIRHSVSPDRTVSPVSFVGLLGSRCPAVKYGRLYTKKIERVRFINLLENDKNFDAVMELLALLQPIYNWWRQNITSARNPIRALNYALVIYTDASLSGWGAFCDDKRTHGFWPEAENRL